MEVSQASGPYLQLLRNQARRKLIEQLAQDLSSKPCDLAIDTLCNAVGREAIEGLRFLASLPRASAGREKMQPFNWIHSRLFIA